MILFNLNYLLKSLSQNVATLKVRASTYECEFWGDIIQSTMVWGSTDKIRSIPGVHWGQLVCIGGERQYLTEEVGLQLVWDPGQI